ncbi:hypothetical protein GGQ64_003270 [Rhizobium azooxidifex]|uniref:Uncharacterized protein n=1 Tax=Mycoplana azooxidifex TaxID=1636188 RepID=A0A7W6DB85_9HYPH|nr:hypothetical protein [Mycoplana azooxidifex]MBB3978056.1 hypothetical protein [Mycoplana azooxidifex]
MTDRESNAYHCPEPEEALSPETIDGMVRLAIERARAGVVSDDPEAMAIREMVDLAVEKARAGRTA